MTAYKVILVYFFICRCSTPLRKIYVNGWLLIILRFQNEHDIETAIDEDIWFFKLNLQSLSDDHFVVTASVEIATDKI